jgi:TetR/AcrR family transcriptional regulator, transcriptional repressor for nem operon
MRYSPDHKDAARAKLIGAAGRGFRRLGFGGIGVDGLAKEAGMTSGAFYGHFASKAEAFEAAALAGLVELRLAIEGLQQREGDRWLAAFVGYYLSTKRTCELGESCALQSLTPEVARATPETRTAYEAELLRVVQAVAAGLPGATADARRKLAWSILALLAGSVTLARASDDPKVGARIAAAVEAAIATLTASAAG